MSNYSTHFGQALETYMKQQGVTAKELGERTYERMGYSSGPGAAKLISWVLRGCIYGTPSASGRSSRKALPRLSIALEELGVPEDHDLVRIVRESIHPVDALINGGFTYPLPEGFTFAKKQAAQND